MSEKQLEDSAAAATGNNDPQPKGDSQTSTRGSEVSESVLLMARLRAQIEFYFSPQNLSRDTYLRSILASYGNNAVPLSIICNFPKVRELCSGTGRVGGGDPISWIMRSVVGSSVVHVSPDGMWISPILPLPPLDPILHQRLLKQQQQQQQLQHQHHRIIPTNARPLVGLQQTPPPQESHDPITQELSTTGNDTSTCDHQQHQLMKPSGGLTSASLEASLSSQASSSGISVVSVEQKERTMLDPNNNGNNGNIDVNMLQSKKSSSPSFIQLEPFTTTQEPPAVSNADEPQTLRPPTTTTTTTATTEFNSQLPQPQPHHHHVPAVAAYSYHPKSAMYHHQVATNIHHPIAPPPPHAYLHQLPPYSAYYASLSTHRTTIPLPQQPVLPHQGQLQQNYHYPQQQQHQQYYSYYPYPPTGTGFTYMNAAGHRNYFAPTTGTNNNNIILQSKNHDQSNPVKNRTTSIRKGSMSNNNYDKKTTFDNMGKQNRRITQNNRGSFKAVGGNNKHYGNKFSGDNNNTEDGLNYGKSFKSSGAESMNSKNEDNLQRINPSSTSGKPRMTNTLSKNKKKSRRRDDERRNNKGYSRESSFDKKGKDYAEHKQEVPYNDIKLLGDDHFPELTPKQESLPSDNNITQNSNNLSMQVVSFTGYADALRQSKNRSIAPPYNSLSSSLCGTTNVIGIASESPVDEGETQNERDDSALGYNMKKGQSLEVKLHDSISNDVSSASEQLSQICQNFEESATIKAQSFEEPETIAIGALTGTKCSATPISNGIGKDKAETSINSNDEKREKSTTTVETTSNFTVSEIVNIINQSEPTPQEACRNLTMGTEDIYTKIDSPKTVSAEATLNNPSPSVWVNKLSFIDVVRKQA